MPRISNLFSVVSNPRELFNEVQEYQNNGATKPLELESVVIANTTPVYSSTPIFISRPLRGSDGKILSPPTVLQLYKYKMLRICSGFILTLSIILIFILAPFQLNGILFLILNCIPVILLFMNSLMCSIQDRVTRIFALTSFILGLISIVYWMFLLYLHLPTE